MTITMDDLFEFQKEDVDKLREKRSCLIANEMGSGKTYEAIALDILRRNGDNTQRTLVVCNKSQINSTWGMHYERLTSLPVVCYANQDRAAFVKSLKAPGGGIWIINWEALRIVTELRDINWYCIIADECQKMKNKDAQQTRSLKRIKAYFKIALSGTPITNKPHDYWSVLNWLFPESYRSYWRFYKDHVEYEIVYPAGYHKIKGPKNVGILLDKIGPYYVRHLKKQQCCEHHPQGIMPYLPDKYYSEIWVDLTPEQKIAYKQMNKDMIAWVGAQKDKPLVAPVVIAKLMRLQQFAIAFCDIEFDDSDPDNIESHVSMTMPSSKIDACMELLLDEPDKQFVIFSQFSKPIYLLAEEMKRKGIDYATYTGDTKSQDRERIVADFLGGKIRVFAGTIKAGGIGLDLYSASTVIFLDRSWSPAENLQAEDRLHRHGQKDAVQVIDIMARHTVDRGRKQDIAQKWEWIQELLGDVQAKVG